MPLADEPLLAHDDIQGDVLAGFNTEHNAFLYFRILDAGRARSALTRLAQRVTTLGQALEFKSTRRSLLVGGRGGAARAAGGLFTTVGLTSAGLRSLVPGIDFGGLDVDFVTGLDENTSRRLGDFASPLDPGHPERWKIGGGARQAHLLVRLASNDLEALDREQKSLEQQPGMELVFQDAGRHLPKGIEHFGFQDGISQPGVRGRVRQNGRTEPLTRRSSNDEERAARGGQILVWPGQFVFGYPSQGRSDARESAPALAHPAWARNGSLLVYRRLLQDVQAFWDSMHDHAKAFGIAGIGAEEVAARLVGRWKNGNALVRHPAKPGPRDGANQENDFLFGSDLLGDVCPRAAHIRKVNPRDLPTDQGPSEETMRMMLLRRGIPFGPLFEQATANAERGLQFFCYQTSIREQFARVTTRWANKANAPEGGTPGVDLFDDLLIGQRTSAEPRAADLALGAKNVRVLPGSRWVVPNGGGYFFVPARSFLRNLG